MTIYRRSFTLEACHFNGQDEYTHLDLADKMRAEGQPHHEAVHLRHCLAGSHGHNFRVVITIHHHNPGMQLDWLVDDIELSNEIVAKYNRCNLSVHPRFREKRWRATTERLAQAICEDVMAKVDDGLNEHTVHVAVFETPDIEANYSLPRP